ncbi:MAG: peptidase S16 [Chitinophagaceae bacterium]|nr:MAG: peptidase S16 [Chitinophagaceae bacterium]
MTNFIPIFPLSLVVYPGETLPLHIFEPRYKQLVKECFESKRTFGVPAVLNNKMQEMGTLLEITSVVKEYENGEMDIMTKGVQIFTVLEHIKAIPDKLYSGAIVNYPQNILSAPNRELMTKVITAVKELHRLLNISKDFKKPEDQLNSYDIGHHAGMSIEEEYELLGLMKELQRQEYIRRHLQKVLPMLVEMEALKEKVKLNGHFRNLSPLDLDINL